MNTSESEGYFTSDSDTTIVYHSEREYVKLSAEVIKMSDEVYFRNPILINIIDSLLIITDQNKNDVFSFISLVTESRIATFGKSGGGQDEIQSFAFSIDTDNHGKPFFDFLDWGSSALNRIHLDRLFDTQNTLNNITERVLTLTPDFMMAQRVSQLNDSVFVGGFGIRDGLLFFKNINSGKTKYLPFIPETESTYNYQNIGMVYRGHMAVNYSKERIAIALENFNQVQIYDFNGRLLSISQPKSYIPEYLVNENSSSNFHYYNGISVTKDRIFASHYGVQRSETRDLMMSSDGQVIDTRKGDKSDRPVSKIHIFDWDGNLLEKYELDSRLRAIAINKTGNVLYGLDIYDVENPIRKILLPKSE